MTRLINNWLSHFDVAISRRSHIVELETELQALRLQAQIHTQLPQAITRQEIDSMRIDLLRHQIATKWNLIDYLVRKQTNFERVRKCPLCNYEGAQEEFRTYATQCIFEGGTLTRHQCPVCDVIFGADKMFHLTDAELTQDYVWHYRAFSEGDSTELELRAFHAMKPTKQGIYLNYGAGSWSKTIQILRGEGWNVYAYEPHSASSSGEAHIITDRETLSTMRFDGIFSNNLLEHLRYPVQELIFMRSLLKPVALMSHATPCFEYLYEYTRFHLFFFLGRSRGVLAKKAGLTVQDFVVDGDFMNCIYKSAEQ